MEKPAYLEDLEIESLREMGYIHITGLPAGKSKGRIYFPQRFWNTLAFDGTGVSLRVRANGQVWMRYSCEHDLWCYKLASVCYMPHDIAYSELTGSPLFFDAAVFIAETGAATLAIRVANPYYDFQMTHPSDLALLG